MQQYELDIINYKLDMEAKKEERKLEENKRMREYRQRPEVKERIKEYEQRPEVKERRKEYNQRPEVKERRKEYNQRPEVKQKKNMAKYKRQKIILTVNSIKDITIQWARLKKRQLIRQTKRRKNLTNITVELTPEDILNLIPKDLKCPVYNVPFVFNANSPWNLSLDRINNNKSYTKDNVVVVSVKANTIKNTATSKELYKIADFYYELEKCS